ncbi:MAG: tetratricopeptide repeat protein [Lachnospiraceae bacterium]
MLTGMVLCMLCLNGCRIANPREDEELAFRQAGIAFLEKGEYGQAAETFQKALDNSNARLTETELDICYYKAYALSQGGQIAKAMEQYDAIIDYDKKAVYAYLQRGNLKAARGKLREACKDYETAISLDEGDYVLYLSAYKNLLAAGEEEPIAEKYLQRAIQLGGKTGADYRYRGQMYMLLKDYDNARQQLSHAENEGDEQARLYMAQVLSETGDVDGALAIYESYAKEHKQDEEAQYNLIRILMERQEYEMVLSYMEQAKKIVTGEQKKALLKYEVMATEKQGDLEGARILLEDYLSLYPKDQQAEKELVFLKSCLTKQKS